MNFEQSIRYLYSLGHETLAMKLGLETVRILARGLGQPEQKFPAVHIAGTNGKGSTAALTEAILRAAGYRVGLYTSPHLVTITERIRVDGKPIEDDVFARRAGEVRSASERLVESGELGAPPTFFEQVTMIAYLYFAEMRVELAVLEVGLGGRLDATNLCHPVVTAITPVGLDHQRYLGETLPEIAGEKAGIIKTGVPVVVAPQKEEAMRVIAARAAELSAPLIPVSNQAAVAEKTGSSGRYRLRYRNLPEARLGLRGRYQVTNALTAIHIAQSLIDVGWKIPVAAIIEGLERAQWPGRLELIESPSGQAPILLDGAHNPDGARALRDFLEEHYSQMPVTLIFGAMQDKAISEMTEILFPAAKRIILTKITNPRAADPVLVAKRSRGKRDLIVSGDVCEALAEGRRVTPADGLIVACGSLFLIGEIRRVLNRQD